jgi:hypothetical protein
MAITKVTSGLISADASSIDLNIDAGTLYLDVSENKVGIGTTSPSYTLDVNGTIGIGTTSVGQSLIQMLANSTNGANTIHFGDATSGTASYTGYINYAHDSNSLQFATNGGTERMRIDSSGSLLVNTTSAGSNRLKIVGDASRYGILSENLSGYGAFNLKSTTVAQTWSIGAVDNSSNSDLFIYGGSSAGTKVTLDSSGKVGIGVTPSEALHIEYNTVSGGDNYIHMRKTDQGAGQGAFIGIPTASNNLRIMNHAANSITFHTTTSDAERMRIDSSGNVLQGTTTQGGNAALTVKSSAGSNTGIMIIEGDTNDGWGLYSVTSDDSFRITQYTHANTYSDKLIIDSSGNVHIDGLYSTGGRSKMFEINPNAIALKSSTNLSNFQYHQEFANTNGTVGSITTNGSATAFNTSSDYRLKENVDYTWDATTRLKQLKPARFNFIADADTTVDGFLAHEVSSVVPEAISGTKDAVDSDGNPEYQGIDQSKLVPLLTKAIQEQQTIIDDLKTRIETLENA